MACITCSSWSLQKSGEMARQGFARCLKGPTYVFMSPRSTCLKHEPAPAGAAAVRVEWIRKKSSVKSPGAAPGNRG